MKIGAQLFTVHEQCKTLDDFAESLKKVADIGYTSVQVSGTCPYEPEWLKEQLDKNGLTCDITHIPFAKIIEETDEVIKAHDIFGCKYIGLGSMPHIFEPDVTKKAWTDFVEKALPAAKKIKESGHYFMYHNHAVEFKDFDGEFAMQYLKDNIPADLMGFTLDTYWVKAGGYNPVEWLKILSDRIPCIHFKDMLTMPNGEKHFAPIGKGELDFEKIIATAIDLGVEAAFVEQDRCYGEDPFACLKQSYDYLKSMGLK